MQNFLWTLSYSSFINAINPLIVTGQVSPAKHSASLTSKSLTHSLDELPVPGNVFNTLQASPSIFFPYLPGGLIWPVNIPRGHVRVWVLILTYLTMQKKKLSNHCDLMPWADNSCPVYHIPTITICLLDRSKMNSGVQKWIIFQIVYYCNQLVIGLYDKGIQIFECVMLIYASKSAISSHLIVDERRRTKLLKASSEETSSKTGFNLKQFHRSKSDIPAGDKPQRAPLLHQSSGNVLFHFPIQTFIDHKEVIFGNKCILRAYNAQGCKTEVPKNSFIMVNRFSESQFCV